jgi:hypothetical protein
MVETTCGSCGGTFLYVPGASTRVACPHCDAVLGGPPQPERLEHDVEAIEAAAEAIETVVKAPGLAVRAVEASAETILVPEYHAPRKPTRLDGTTLLKTGDALEPASKTRVTLHGFLTEEGKPSGEGDFRLPSEVTVVGREQGAIRVADSAVSARHFEVEGRGSEFFLRDLGSRNGTFLNGHPVRSAKLKSGDRITAGNTTFSFSMRHTGCRPSRPRALSRRGW